MKAGDKLYNQLQDKRHKENLERIRNLRLFDDDFLVSCFKDSYECTELVLHIILEKPDLKVIDMQVQHTLKNLNGRSVILDIFAKDSEGGRHNIEIQRDSRGAGRKRARYNSSLMDADILPAGDDTENLPDTYVIFIAEKDVIGKDKPIYHIGRQIEETGESFDDGSHIIYVNGEYKDDSPLGLLMKDFDCKDPDDMNYKELAERTRYFKKSEEGVAEMCKIMEDLYNEGRDEGRDEGIKQIAVSLLKDGTLSIEKIALVSGLTIEEIEALAEAERSAV